VGTRNHLSSSRSSGWSARRRLSLKAAREQALTNEGGAPSEHHELIHKLEADWKHALERLHRARQAAED
jgi:hypothetical protein